MRLFFKPLTRLKLAVSRCPGSTQLVFCRQQSIADLATSSLRAGE
jgi:hypothetical protein